VGTELVKMLKKIYHHLLGIGKKPISPPTRIPIIHNYVDKKIAWGHSIKSTPNPGTHGKIHTVVGFSHIKILVGDYVLLSDGDSWNVRYRVIDIEFETDPYDMFFGITEFVDRTDEQKHRDLEMIGKGRSHWMDVEKL
jgi:hypothetical protein